MDATIIWDLEDDADGNLQHIREHDVSIEEAEEVLLSPQSSRAVSPIVRFAIGVRLDYLRALPRSGVRNRGRRPTDVAADHGLRCATARAKEEGEKEMKPRREFRANRKTVAERARERALREEIQRKKPALDDLIREGDCDPDAVMTMGMYFDVQKALQSLKRDRQQRGISIGEVAERSGLDRAVVSRLENGKQDNPTVATLMRYAAAIGKRFLWTYESQSPDLSNGDGRVGRRRKSRSA